MLGRRCVDGNPNLKHPLAPGEHKAKSLAHGAGKTHLHPTGTELGARAGVGEADMSEEIKCEGIKGQVRELRGQFHQTPALTGPVRADDDRGPDSEQGPGVPGRGNESPGLLGEAGPGGSLPGESPPWSRQDWVLSYFLTFAPFLRLFQQNTIAPNAHGLFYS